MISCFLFRYSATRREASYTLNRKSSFSLFENFSDVSYDFPKFKNAQQYFLSRMAEYYTHIIHMQESHIRNNVYFKILK